MWTRRLLVNILFFILSTVTAFASDPDPNPCSDDPSNPDYNPNGCYLPLDTWVYVLVIAAVIFGAYKLHQKQKALTV
ncbi:hypothetical protein [Mucilaginibacter aquariorum]|uniref:Signal peptidase n=1 Tax=Mucilaginibacter aquariorum TaxID=2967225 RepID=A0ABT1T101_9SPHI|nr:hypothetical protein [Mucilaginibacter aquariorum]MCQ6958254.1 hypothetical protein [Mucilaginibacter aquariorum]